MAKRLKLVGGGAGKPFLGLPREMLKSAAFKELSPHACKFLLAIAAEYRGYNNGSLALPYDRARDEFGFTHKQTYYRASRELQERGFLELTKPACRRGIQSSTRFAITWEPINEPADVVGHDVKPTSRASNCWKDWRPEQGPDSELRKIKSEGRIRNSTGTESEPKTTHSAESRSGSGTHKPDFGDLRGPDPEPVLRSTRGPHEYGALRLVSPTPSTSPPCHGPSTVLAPSAFAARLAYGPLAFRMQAHDE